METAILNRRDSRYGKDTFSLTVSDKNRTMLDFTVLFEDVFDEVEYAIGLVMVASACKKSQVLCYACPQ